MMEESKSLQDYDNLEKAINNKNNIHTINFNSEKENCSSICKKLFILFSIVIIIIGICVIIVLQEKIF